MGAGAWGSLLPAVWSFMLALRNRGIGSAWTTIHLMNDGEKKAAELLGIPYEKVTQGGLFPIAYTAVISFMDWDLVRNSGEFIGFEQYTWVLSNPKFWIALRNTFSIFLLSSVPQLIIAIFIAAMLDHALTPAMALGHPPILAQTLRMNTTAPGAMTDMIAAARRANVASSAACCRRSRVG